jgi:acetyltransferase EpsM
MATITGWTLTYTPRACKLNKKVLIIGCGGFAKQIYGTLVDFDFDFKFHDETTLTDRHPFLGQEVIYFVNEKEFDSVTVAVAGTKVREEIRERYSGLPMQNIISEKASVSRLANIKQGNIILENAIIEPDASTGDGLILNVGAQIHHDSTVGKYCEIAPRAVLLGGCNIGDYTFVGTNSTILPNVRVGKSVTVGAGAVVTKNVPDGVTVKGVPAK